MTAEPQKLHPERPTIDHADIRWRVSNTWDKGDTKMGMLVGYIDARTCMEALDALDPQWSAVHGDPIIVGGELVGVPCRVTVNDITRSDVGMPSSVDGLKGAYSDALKRAAVHHGVGRELYELPKIAVECEVDKRSGKAKAPKALPIYHNGRWTIDRQYGWVKYEREPEDQPQDGERASGAGRRAGSLPATTRPAAPRSPEEQALIGQLLEVPGMTIARMTLLADAVGVPKGEKATADQLREMLDRAETPASGVPSAAGREGGGGAGGSEPAPPLSNETVHPESTPDSSGSDGPTPEAGDSPPVASPPAAPTDAEILAAAGEGAEIVPPRPATDAYKALSAPEKAAARAYWQRVDSEPQQETLAAALGAPTSD